MGRIITQDTTQANREDLATAFRSMAAELRQAQQAYHANLADLQVCAMAVAVLVGKPGKHHVSAGKVEAMLGARVGVKHADGGGMDVTIQWSEQAHEQAKAQLQQATQQAAQRAGRRPVID